MFRANTPFVPSNSSAAAQSGGESPKPPAAPQPSRTNVLQVPKPAATVDFFNTDPEPSFPATSNTGKDPFACGGAFGDASPVPAAAHSAFSSTTDLLGAGAAAGGGYHNSSSSNHTSPRFPASPGAQAGLMFDAFNDTPGISPVASFAQFPSSFPPAPASAQRTGSGFDFIEGDPFASNTSASSAGFDSFAPTPTGAASGFDFMTQGSTDPFAANRSGGSSITSSNMNSATNSAFTSNNDLFAFSTAASTSTNAAAAALSAPSPVPLPPALQVPHDPFGAVFLQPTPSGASSVGSASPYTPPSGTAAAPQAYQSQSPALLSMASSHSGTGLSAMGAGARMGGMGGTSGTTGPMMNMGMGMGMSSMNASNGGSGGVGYGMNRNASPVPGMGGMSSMSGVSGGIGYGAGGGSAMMGQYPPQGMGMMSQGQQYGMKQQQQQQPPAMLSQQYRTGPTTTVPLPPRHVDAIGAAFGNLNMGGGQQGYRGPGQQFQSSQLQSQQQQPPASSFDFVQTAVKQHLPTK
uniref:Uncharacterized protein n=1 Tax=Spumella elongata TaxID=89044 RepID=A0A7S3MDJ1_9STRA|mmetsp:Transcript_57792/g.101550  ORF Transcript_57792/g.101550 Transcript_57792/m.101550 type:complete len:520 (+) Transcript_57792:2-1561(+)